MRTPLYALAYRGVRIFGLLASVLLLKKGDDAIQALANLSQVPSDEA